jgi:hypothetical protein
MLERIRLGAELGAPALVVAALLTGCTCGGAIDLDARRDAAAPGDAAIAPPRLDECGNGLDDDGNGRIDDRCPCGPGERQPCSGAAIASRGVGACTDGIQVCATRGVEWGDWGDSACTGDVSPIDQDCSGTDTDCDGAIDEGCPCTVGETSPCGVEFLIGECRAGEQSCRGDGTWSGCDGAIGPRSEICGNGLDEDCDGVPDELCGCVPEPEICRDGIDNDCDGATDEPACEPDWPPADAGPCDPALDAPRPIAPTSTSRVTSIRPTLEWALPPGATGAVIELARDRAITVEGITGDAIGGAWHFWRVRSRSEDGRVSCDTSPTWEFFVPHRDRGTDTFHGSVMDINGDGLADVLFTASWHPDSMTTTTLLHVFFGNRAAAWDVPDQSIELTHAPQGTAARACGDVDGDGFGDAIIGDDQILRGTADGVESAPFFVVDPRPLPTIQLRAIGDVDRDGYSDFAVRDSLARTVVIRRGSPSGPLPPSAPLGYSGASAHDAFWLGDLTGDRYSDVIVSEWNSGDGTGRDTRGVLSIFEGAATGLPLAPTRAPVRSAITVFWGPGWSLDANSDGYRDWLSEVHNAPRDTHDLVRFGGPAGLADPPAQDLRSSTIVIAAGDLDGDGYDDAIASELSWSPSFRGPTTGVGVHRGSAAGIALEAFEEVRDHN